jgi:hypothetical protein
MRVFDYHKAMATQAVPTSTWAKALASLSALAGASGAVLTPLLGSTLAGSVQTALVAISGVLVLLPAASAVILNHKAASAKVQAELDK